MQTPNFVHSSQLYEQSQLIDHPRHPVIVNPVRGEQNKKKYFIKYNFQIRLPTNYFFLINSQ